MLLGIFLQMTKCCAKNLTIWSTTYLGDTRIFLNGQSLSSFLQQLSWKIIHVLSDAGNWTHELPIMSIAPQPLGSRLGRTSILQY